MIYSRELIYDMSGGPARAEHLPCFMSSGFFEELQGLLDELCSPGIEEEDSAVTIETVLTADPGRRVSVYHPTVSGGYIIALPLGFCLQLFALIRRVMIYLDVLNMEVPQFADIRYQVTSEIPPGLKAIYHIYPTLTELFTALKTFDARTTSGFGAVKGPNEEGIQEEHKPLAFECLLIAVDWIVQHEIAHAKYTHYEIIGRSKDVSEAARRLILSGLEIKADVIAASNSISYALSMVTNDPALQDKGLQATAHWTGFAHTCALAVLDPRNIFNAHGRPVNHPHPHYRQEFIFQSVMAEIDHGGLVDGYSGAFTKAGFANAYLHGVDRTVNALFWLCDVIEAKFFDDRFPIYALRKPLEWSDDASSMEYVSLLLAVLVVQIADWDQGHVDTVSAIARRLKKAYFSGRDLDQFVGQDLAGQFGNLVSDPLRGLRGAITRRYYDQRPNYKSMPLVTSDPAGKKVIPPPRLQRKTRQRNRH